MKNSLPLLLVAIAFVSCQTSIDVFEKNVVIPNRAWSSGFKPQISFTVKDTLARYNIYAVIRHTDAYEFNNIWINIYTKIPGDSMMRKQQLDLKLATDEKGWLASGMDDIFEHRILITGRPEPLTRAGVYTFSLENIMRVDPLPEVLNVGIRVEKAK
ncbi:MAG TPA: gliding motility lipoprotein GldH [Flavitalea sp.]|nr:gliding motility lipoprotein GldH [Flavitalea sp.]